MDKTGRTSSFITYDEATLAQLDPMAQHAMLPPPETFAPAPDDLAARRPAPGPRTPDWVADPVKWATLSRAERRALIAHHKRETRRR